MEYEIMDIEPGDVIEWLCNNERLRFVVIKTEPGKIVGLCYEDDRKYKTPHVVNFHTSAFGEFRKLTVEEWQVRL